MFLEVFLFCYAMFFAVKDDICNSESLKGAVLLNQMMQICGVKENSSEKMVTILIRVSIVYLSFLESFVKME